MQQTTVRDERLHRVRETDREVRSEAQRRRLVRTPEAHDARALLVQFQHGARPQGQSVKTNSREISRRARGLLEGEGQCAARPDEAQGRIGPRDLAGDGDARRAALQQIGARQQDWMLSISPFS